MLAGIEDILLPLRRGWRSGDHPFIEGSASEPSAAGQPCIDSQSCRGLSRSESLTSPYEHTFLSRKPLQGWIMRPW